MHETEEGGLARVREYTQIVKWVTYIIKWKWAKTKLLSLINRKDGIEIRFSRMNKIQIEKRHLAKAKYDKIGMGIGTYR